MKNSNFLKNGFYYIFVIAFLFSNFLKNDVFSQQVCGNYTLTCNVTYTCDRRWVDMSIYRGEESYYTYKCRRTNPRVVQTGTCHIDDFDYGGACIQYALLVPDEESCIDYPRSGYRTPCTENECRQRLWDPYRRFYGGGIPDAVPCGGGSAPPPPSTCTAPQGANCTNAGGTCINTNCASCNGTIRIGLCPGGSNIRCCIPNPTPTFTPTPTPTNTPTPTPIPDDPWCKYKDASIITNAAINNIIPASPLTPYDSSDPGNRVLVDSSSANSAGVVGAQSISIGGAQVSATGWDITGTTFTPQFTIQGYIDYVRSKKSSMVNEGSIVSNKINILSGNQTISESDLAGKRPLIIVVEGNVTLSSATNILNQANEPQVIMATGTITFPTTMTEANGSYIANSVDFGTTANQGLKIVGNLVTETALSCTRQWSDGKKPGVFIVFDPSHYIEMIEMLSTTTYDWRQIQ